MDENCITCYMLSYVIHIQLGHFPRPLGTAAVATMPIYIYTQRGHYIRMLVADGQGPSISYREGSISRSK